MEGEEEDQDQEDRPQTDDQQREQIEKERKALKDATNQKFKIYFDRFAIQELLTNLEETNLFLINHVQEEE